MKVCVLLSNGFEEVEAIGTIALLKRSGLEVDIYALKDIKARGKHDLELSNLIHLQDVNVNDYEALLLPGGPHYQELEASSLVKDIIIRFMKERKLVAGICAAPTILGHMGYLKGKNYTCFTSMNEDFGGTYLDQYVVRDGNLITARSAAASIDFAFEIISYLQGEKQAEKIKKQIYY
ncbi:MAG: DJ-1/PfpI family protein [Traorella sp.]